MRNFINNELIKALVKFGGIFLTIAAVVWTFVEPNDHWLWFSRYVAGLVLLGISALIDPKK